MNEDLTQLKVGDDAWIGDGYHNVGSIVQVTKVTPTMIICGSSRFRKNGSLVGGSGWFQKHLGLATQERKDKIEHAKLSNYLSNYDYRKASLEDLREIYIQLKRQRLRSR